MVSVVDTDRVWHQDYDSEVELRNVLLKAQALVNSNNVKPFPDGGS
jgi:hypothetical protein